MLSVRIFAHISVLAVIASAAAIVQEKGWSGNQNGYFHCGAYDDDAECRQWIATTPAPVTFEALNKTVIVPGGTEFTPETGIAFDTVAAVPGAVVQSGVLATSLERRDKGRQCRNGGPLADDDFSHKHCQPEDRVPSKDSWTMGAHNCKNNKTRSGKYYLCCTERRPCPAWRVGRLGGCINNIECKCKRVGEWNGWHGGECFK